MQTTPLHTIAELFGIKNFVTPTPSTAHFQLEISSQSYILDVALVDDLLVLCLSRELLAHEEHDEKFLQAAIRIANEHKPCLAYHKNHCIIFVEKIASDAKMDAIEKSIENCVACHEALREI